MTEAEIRLLLRITARTSFLLFSAAFVADALPSLWPANFAQWLARNRDRFFFGFTASHTVHLGAIIALLVTLGTVPRREKIVLIVGGSVFLLIYALAAAALARSITGKQLALIGSAGFTSFAMYTFWLVFAAGFVPRMVKGWPIYTVLGILSVGTLLIRIAGGARKARAATA